jgi:hypothetical protein
MKKKEPTFNELFARFIVQIKNREPEKEITSEIMEILRSKWEKEPIRDFKAVVLKAEQNALKVLDIIKKSDLVINEFQLGYSLSGEPIIHTHIVQRQMKTKDPKRYSKKGSQTKDNVSVIECFPNNIF